MADDLKKDDILSREEIKETWKLIDRRLKRAVPQDDEISGEPNYLIGDPESIPLSIKGETSFTALGGLSAGALYENMEKSEKSKYIRNIRYQKLSAAHGKPEVEGILNIYADEANTEDQEGETLKILHPNKKVADIVKECFERLGIYDKSWEIIWNMCGFGDEFYEVIPNQKATRVNQLNWIPREHLDRVEKNGILQGFKESKVSDQDSNYAFKIQTDMYNKGGQDENLVFPFRIVHWRIPSSIYAPYGKSIIDSIVPTTEQLELMIKAMIIARVTRSPERRVYNVDVGNLQGEKAIKYANEAVGFLKKKKILQMFGTPNRQDSIRDVFGATEDIVLPKRAGSEGNSITTLEQLDQINVEDAEFLRDRIFPPVGIPRQYLFDDTFAYANTNLSSKSVPFAKKIKRVQRYYLLGLYKIATIELKLNRVSDQDISDLTILMNNPSNLDEQERITIDTSLWGLIASMKGLNTESVFYPDYLIYKEQLGLNDDEIVQLMKLSQLQQAGQNIFNFLPAEERPEGAEDLANAPIVPPTPAGEAGSPPAGGAIGAPGTPGAPGELPPEVQSQLGPPTPTAPAGETTPAGAETAEISPIESGEIYLEEDEEVEEKVQSEFENENDRRKVLMEEALKKKDQIVQKIAETIETINDLREKKKEELNKEISEHERRRTGYRYIENAGEVDGFNEWLKTHSANQKEYITE